MSRAAHDSVVRFGFRDRIQHTLVTLIFFALVLTGMPQKFHEAGVSKTIVNILGGIHQVRFFHRIAGISFAVMLVLHLAGAVGRVVTGKSTLSMVPGGKDIRDMVTTLRYYLGASKVRAAFDRFDYKEKFEYWGIVFGGLIMISTGFALLFPVQATALLPGQLIPAAKLAHGNEGLMAFLVVILWHIYNVIFAPDVFPGKTTIFTGKISREHMREEHALEYIRMFPAETDEVMAELRGEEPEASKAKS